MRVVLPPANAAFNAAAGTITFSTTIPASLSHVLFVANLTRGVVYFDPKGESGNGYLSTATYASPVLSLPGINTVEHANGDRLFIEWDDGTSGGGGGGGGGGDASAAKQDEQTAQLQAINADLGVPNAAAADTDDGTFGLIPLLKRLLGKVPAQVSGYLPVTLNPTGPAVTALNNISANSSAPKGYDPIFDKLVVGTSRDKLRDEFVSFDTTNTWEVIATGAGMSITVDGVAGGARYLNVATGVTPSAETIIQSRSSLRMPVKLGFALSMSQRIANQEVFVELVGVDANGTVETDTLFPSANFNDAANAAGYKFDGTTATNAIYSVRSSGASELASPVTGFAASTTATGTGPNFIPAAIWEISADMEECVWQTRPIDSLSTVGAAFKRTHKLPDPQKQYKVRIRVRNLSTAPASTTNVRFHFLRVLDTTRFTVDFARHMGRLMDAADALPVGVSGGTLGTVSNVAAIANGTNAIGDVGVQYRASATGAALTSSVVSAATTNATSVKSAAGRVIGWTLANTSSSWRYVKLHNVTTVPVAGTTAVRAPIAIAPNSTSNMTMEGGISFSTGIAYTIVTGAADSDATPVALSDVVGAIFYI